MKKISTYLRVHMIIVYIFGLTIYYLPEIYQEIENRRVNEIKHEIFTDLNLPNAEKTAKVNELVKKM